MCDKLCVTVEAGCCREGDWVGVAGRGEDGVGRVGLVVLGGARGSIASCLLAFLAALARLE